MSTKTLDRLYQIFFTSDLVGVRVALGLAEIIWGVASLCPGNSFERARTYSGMAQIADENTWGVIWLIIGIIQFVIVYTETYHSKPAVFFAAFNCLLWWLVVISLYINVWPLNLVASADASLVAMSTWIWIRSGWIPNQIRGGERRWI